jgi:hypothetical protein
MEKWRHGYMERRDIETWRHGDMETWRHGHGDTGMETSNGKRKPR